MTRKADEQPAAGLSRRSFLQGSVAATLATGMALDGQGAGAADAPAGGRGPYNILLIVSDQERYFEKWPFPVPGRERLTAMGVTFTNHQIAANVCSPSRSVMYTGQHIQHTGVFDNVNAPWQPSMSTEIPTLGHMLRRVGYHTAYKGKCHLAIELEETNDLEAPQKILTEVMEGYGFSDYYGVGDIIASTRGGYLHDEIITSMAVQWLRSSARTLAARSKPWFLAVNLVNPHDVMYVNTDRPGHTDQLSGDPVMDILPPPDTDLYRADWKVPLPASRHQAFDAKGRPGAHREFQRARTVLLGNWPDDDRRWRTLQNYYFNCIRDCDRHVEHILDEVQQQGLLENTIVVFTSDHGELGGAHQMHGKGACAYREQNHVPLIIVHPRERGGQRCSALTSHLDLAPTILGLTALGDEKLAPLKRDLHGHDLSPLLHAPSTAKVDAVRAGALFSFNMFAYLDGRFLESLKAMRDARKLRKVTKAVRTARTVKPALQKRGAIRCVFDGRYRFARYFSPKEHHLPKTMEALLGRNDVELYDLASDPHETHNLATNVKKHGDLIESLSARLNALIETEVGEDNGASLPLSKLAGWDLEGADL